MSDGILAGLAGATQGISSGMQANDTAQTNTINQAVGIQNLQNSKQESAIKEMQFGELKKKQDDLNKPVWEEDIVKSIPKESKEWFMNDIKDKLQTSSDGKRFATKRDLAEYKETMDGFKQHERITTGIDFLSKENSELEKQIQQHGTKFQTAAQDLKYKVDKLRKNHENIKADKLLADAKKNMSDPDTPEGQIVIPLQKLQQQYKTNKDKITQYQVTLNGADEAIKDAHKKYPWMDKDTITGAFLGDKAAKQQMYNEIVRYNESMKAKPTTIVMPSANEVDIMAKQLSEGKITLADISKRGGIAQQAKILKRASEMNPDLDPRADQAATQAFASAISQQQKQIGAMGSFVKNMEAQVDKVKTLSKKLETYDARILNLPLRSWRGTVAGSADQAKYDMYITEIENEIGKLATGSAASISELSVGAQEKWGKIHDKNLSVKDMISLLEETKQAGKMRMKSVEDQLKETKDNMRNRGKKKEEPKLPEGLKAGW